MSKILLGAHMSIAGGLEQALVRGHSINCTAIQLFLSNNRQWHKKPLTAEQISLFKDTTITTGVQHVIAHASYLANIASPDYETTQKSVAALTLELSQCGELGIPYLVIHPGAYLDSSLDTGINRIGKNLDYIFTNASGNAHILLEIMAGQGSTIGSTFEQLQEIREKSHHAKRIGICFDTCHAFAAGYRFDTAETYARLWEAFDSIIGLSLLKAIHINDSKAIWGSHIDRHEHIGKGAIGIHAFENIMNDKRFGSIPKILETPKKDLKDDIENMKTLKRLIKKVK